MSLEGGGSLRRERGGEWARALGRFPLRKGAVIVLVLSLGLELAAVVWYRYRDILRVTRAFMFPDPQGRLWYAWVQNMLNIVRRLLP